MAPGDALRAAAPALHLSLPSDYAIDAGTPPTYVTTAWLESIIGPAVSHDTFITLLETARALLRAIRNNPIEVIRALSD